MRREVAKQRLRRTFLAAANRLRTRRAPTPTYISSNSDPDLLRAVTGTRSFTGTGWHHRKPTFSGFVGKMLRRVRLELKAGQSQGLQGVSATRGFDHSH